MLSQKNSAVFWSKVSHRFLVFKGLVGLFFRGQSSAISIQNVSEFHLYISLTFPVTNTCSHQYHVAAFQSIVLLYDCLLVCVQDVRFRSGNFISVDSTE